jgi:hypothetical protein
MSDLEIEKAAMGPRRWTELCGVSEKQASDAMVKLRPRGTRIINDSFDNKFDSRGSTLFFIVPGGRYLVCCHSSPCGISVLDLGNNSSADCKLIASIEEGKLISGNNFEVQATPDGMGLTIFWSNS